MDFKKTYKESKLKAEFYNELYEWDKAKYFFEKLGEICRVFAEENLKEDEKEYSELVNRILVLYDTLETYKDKCYNVGIEFKCYYPRLPMIFESGNIKEREHLKNFLNFLAALNDATFNDFCFQKEEVENLRLYVENNKNSNVETPVEFLIEKEYNAAKEKLEKYEQANIRYKKLKAKKEKYPKIFFTKKDAQNLEELESIIRFASFNKLEYDIKSTAYKIFNEFNFRQLSTINSILQEIEEMKKLLEFAIRKCSEFEKWDFTFEQFEIALCILHMNEDIDDAWWNDFLIRFNIDWQNKQYFFSENKLPRVIAFSLIERKAIDYFIEYLEKYYDFYREEDDVLKTKKVKKVKLKK